jgi:hypothetical protein
MNDNVCPLYQFVSFGYSSGRCQIYCNGCLVSIYRFEVGGSTRIIKWWTPMTSVVADLGAFNFDNRRAHVTEQHSGIRTSQNSREICHY